MHVQKLENTKSTLLMPRIGEVKGNRIGFELCDYDYSSFGCDSIMILIGSDDAYLCCAPKRRRSPIPNTFISPFFRAARARIIRFDSSFFSPSVFRFFLFAFSEEKQGNGRRLAPSSSRKASPAFATFRSSLKSTQASHHSSPPA